MKLQARGWIADLIYIWAGYSPRISIIWLRDQKWKDIMNKVSRIMFKLLAIVLFLLAVASVLATLFAAPGSTGSPGLFFAVVLTGLGKWLLGKSQGKSARETFGRAVEVADTRDAAP